jgi:glucose/arabinose dehydrogenase
MVTFLRRVVLFALGCLIHVTVYAQTYPTGFAQVLIKNGIASPTAIAFAPDGRIFVAEQTGKLRVIKDNTLLPTPFIQLTVNASGERGLIGIALDPDFSTNNFIYLYYTVPGGSPLHNRVSRFTANGDVALAGSEVIILELDPLSSATNHNGGDMHFGKEGKLYIAIGENATPANAQNLDTYHGKLLRINKDGSVPEGNPFTTGSEQRKRVWAYGLRNPYTFAVHPESGQILLNDVGQGTWEEINDATTGGLNFGWPTTEGKFDATTYPNFTNPVYAYAHGSGDGKGCAITGGTFFYPSATNYPSVYLGKYFFQDLCNQWINTLDVSNAVRSPFAIALPASALALTTGIDGNLYFVSRDTGALYKIIYTNTTIPYITNHPVAMTVAEGESATFNVSALGTTPFSYQWQKDGADILNATASSLRIDAVTSQDEGDYTVIVANSVGSTTSNSASLTVIMNAAPVAEITLPQEGSTYTAGTEIEFSGTGNDAEDGVLPATNFRWQINFHHDTHKHDEPPVEGISNGTFSIPDVGETSDNVWYRIILTVTDSDGLEGKDSVDILPNKSTIAITTDPPGLEVLVDGQPFPTPVDITSVEGILRTIGVNTPQSIEGDSYEFTSWSNGADVTQTFATPEEDLQLIASFSPIVGTEGDDQNMDLLFYPNPADQGFVMIDLTEAKHQVVQATLINSFSQHVLSFQKHLSASENSFSLFLENQAPGIYMLLIKTGESIIMKKLMIR